MIESPLHAGQVSRPSSQALFSGAQVSWLSRSDAIPARGAASTPDRTAGPVCRPMVAALAAAVILLSAPSLPAKDTDKDRSPSPQEGVPRPEVSTSGGSPGIGSGKTDPLAALPGAELAWLTDLDDAKRRARNERKPILIHITATWCPACRMLDRTLKETEVQDALARWICVEIDADQNEELAGSLGVSGVPALRLQTPSGRPAGSHDGTLPARQLITWLDEHYNEARAAVDDVLMETGQPLPLDVVKLIGLFDRRDPAIREAAMRRLLPYPETARGAVVESVRDGNLATRLVALELLGVWKAPLAGLDPWDLETMTEPRLEALDRWAADTPAPKAEEVLEAGEEELKAAADQIDRMLRASDTEAEAIAERLARFGQQLLPAVTQRMATAAGDRPQMLLRALRYRLVASDALALQWPGGLWRLASSESDQRRKAADELAKRATRQDQSLLLELFSDTDPLVREISLRGLQNIGGAQSVAALTRLLGDPEPNVRAAVLKQLEENPQKSMLPAVTAYLEKESDPDLVVHGIRFLRGVKAKEALKGMMALLQHPSWQVRAEAAEGLSKSEALSSDFGPGGSTEQALKVDISVGLLKLLSDREPFVVAKALEGLADVDMEVAVDHLVGAVKAHPSLAHDIIRILAAGQQMRPKALPHLVAFCRHKEPAIRAAAITGLAQSSVATAEKQLLFGLKDSDTLVRTAAADAMFSMFDQAREQKAEELTQNRARDPFGSSSRYGEVPSPALFDSMFEKLKGVLGKTSGPAEPTEPAPVEVAPALDLPAQPAPAAGTAAEAVQEDPAMEEPPSGAEEGQAETPKDDSEDRLAGLVWETWLAQRFEGKNRAKWIAEAATVLATLLQADSAEERVAAARALVPLGQSAAAIPVLLAAVDSQPSLLERGCAVLPWLPWQERQETYARLRGHATDAGSLNTLIEAACGAPDRRIAGLLWKELADDSLDENLVSVLQRGLISAYTGRTYYWSDDGLSGAALRDFHQAVVEMLDSGSLVQRLVAMALCSTFKTPEARPKATAFLNDPQAGDELKIASARYLLLSLPEREAVATAVRLLGDGRETIRVAAAARLAGVGQELTVLGRGSSARYDQTLISYDSSNGKPIVPLPPKTLKVDDIRPVYDRETNEKVRAYLGHLLALFGDGRGLDELIRYWRAHKDEGFETSLVYQAIASLDDASKAPVLVEIYEGLESYSTTDFYWTIRPMTGAEILRLRKRIRDEVGMSELR